MIATFVTFRHGDDFDEQAVWAIADAARPKFEGMPGLRSKLFTVDAGTLRGRERVCLGFRRGRPRILHG